MVLHGAQVVVVPLLALLTAVSSQLPKCTTLTGVPGQCVSVPDCPDPKLLQEIRSNTTSLRKAICKITNNAIYICCPPQSLLPSQCGIRPLGDNILHGEDAILFDWPWMVLLESLDTNGRVSLVCGGALISDRYVLTAAHCVDEASGFTLRSVRLGEHTISRNPDCNADRLCAPNFQRVVVSEIIIHENYGSPFGCRSCNDIALLRLNDQVTNSLAVGPICLPQNFQSDLGFSQNELASKLTWVTGWGTTETSIKSDVLQQVQLTINNTLCTSIALDVFPDPNMMLCAGELERDTCQGETESCAERRLKDTCQGDSGGPMVIGNVGETNYYIVGIVSRGPRVCGAEGTGGIYTNVSHYVPWIIKNLRA